MSSIRTELLRRLVVTMGLLWLVGTLAVTWGVQQLLVQQFDALTRAKIDALAARIEQEGGTVEFDFAPENAPEFSAGETPEYFQLWVERGGLRSESLGEAELDASDLRTEAPRADVQHAWNLSLPDGRRGRAMGVDLEIAHYAASTDGDPGPERFRLVLARGRRALDASVWTLLAGAVGTALIAGIAIVRLGSGLIDRGLQPIARVEAYARSVEDPNLAPALDVASVPLELQPIAASLEDLVRRLGRRVTRERQTTANIAHELRTPISELLLVADVALRYGGHSTDARETFQQMRDSGIQMRRLVSTLLELARLEGATIELDAESVDLARMARESWLAHSEAVHERGLELDLSGQLTLESDPSMAGILVGNLIGNAVAHAPAGSRVAGSCDPEARRFELWNDAPGLDTDALAQLTQPFWRASAARGEREHFGLGLALCQRIAELLGARLGFVLEAGRLGAIIDWAPAR